MYAKSIHLLYTKKATHEIISCIVRGSFFVWSLKLWKISEPFLYLCSDISEVSLFYALLKNLTSNTIDRKAKAFSWVCILFKKSDGSIANGKERFLAFNQWKHRFPFYNIISKSSAKGDDITVFCLICIGGTGFTTASASITFGVVNMDLCIGVCDSMLTTDFAANATLYAAIRLPGDTTCAFDPNIIFFCFQAVVLASGNAKFKFMW